MTAVLALNAGSSGLKYALFTAADPPERLLSGHFERIGQPGGPADHASCLDPVLRQVSAAGRTIRAVGHRIVHGGPRYDAPTKVAPDLVTELRRISPFDPEHLPAEIALLEAVSRRFPDLPQVACFDTAFHRDLPRVSRLLPLPRKYEAAGIRKYGFHGLSYQSLVDQLRRDPGGLPRRLILAHLGNGASLAAVLDGKSVDTTMAFTPTAGIPMSRRSGDLDPGLVAYLARTEGMTAEQFHEMVNTRSGLLGLSETSSDVRDLLARERDDPRAAEALDVFCHRVKQAIGAFTATLGGLDALVFSGGIGENSAEIRDRICAGLACLGRFAVRVLRTDEELQICRSTVEILKT
jgi:acetate kinase